MDRSAYQKLLEWKDTPGKKPLILKGVRQCGKTYLMKKFGEENYKEMLYLEFSENESLCRIFDGDLLPERILAALSIKYRTKITENTLLIFDEIQACPRALTSLKYFNENTPQYDIICAGSLLGLQGKGSFPVGKVSFLNIHPMDFKEFLNATDPGIFEYMENNPIDDFIMDRLSDAYSMYRTIGGMPEAVSSWIEDKDMNKVENILNDICESYRMDFLKHVPDKEIKKVNLIWSSIPDQLAKENKRFFFGHAVKGARAKDLEDSLQWLIDAGMVHKVTKIDVPSIPFSKDSENMFKLYMMDIGILRTMANITAADMIEDNLNEFFNGGLTENLVACELMSYGYDELHYWSSDNKAEVDFIIRSKTDIVPVEVKKGKHYRAAALHEYIDKYSPNKAIVISGKVPNQNGVVQTIPLTMIWSINSSL